VKGAVAILKPNKKAKSLSDSPFGWVNDDRLEESIRYFGYGEEIFELISIWSMMNARLVPKSRNRKTKK